MDKDLNNQRATQGASENIDRGPEFEVEKEMPAEKTPSDSEVPETAIDDNVADIPVPPSIKFVKQGEADRYLVAQVQPSEDFGVTILKENVQKWIEGQGCEDWFMHDEKIALFLREVRRLEKPKEYIFAERKDCNLEVQVSADRLKGWIRVSPSFGGNPVTEPLLRRALEEQGIRFGINDELIPQIVLNGSCEKELVAKGIPPIPGENAKFEPLVHESSHKGVPQEREDGRVDYKDLGLFLSVTKGTPLLRRIPPTGGIAGTGVDGNPIPAPAGKDRPLHAGTGAAISKEDPNLAIAGRAGQPNFTDFSVKVDETLELDTVNPATGDVNFDGNVLIRGPVEAGFKVRAGVDLTILDTVEGANLSAGRNMAILSGVYGRHKSELRAKGNLQAKFLSECDVYCGGNVEISDLLAHCNVVCEGSLHLGTYGGKGQAYGGRLIASREVRARILGSVSESPTLVEVIPPPILALRYHETKSKIESMQKDHDGLRKNLQSLKNISSGGKDMRIREMESRAAVLADQLEELRKEQAEIQEKLDAARKGKIRADQVSRGVTLRVGSARQVVESDMLDVFLQEPPEATKT
jgi:uncharacterized protein (DUF342 family)